MNLEGRTVWQHAAGDRAHEHSHICFDWDVILSGGPKQLEKEMNEGDIVALKLGRTILLAIGILGKYEWCEAFDDIDGWGLGYTRRVCWLWQADKREEFPDWTFQMGTTQRLNSTIVIEWIKAELAGVDNAVDWQDIKQFDFPKEKTLMQKKSPASFSNKDCQATRFATCWTGTARSLRWLAGIPKIGDRLRNTKPYAI